MSNHKIATSGSGGGYTRKGRRTQSAEAKDKTQIERAKDARAALIERFRQRLTPGQAT